MRFMVIKLDGRFFDRSIHSLDLSVRLRMINFAGVVLFVLPTNAIEMHKRLFIFLTSGKLNADISQNRMNVIWHDRDQAPWKTTSRVRV